MAKDIIDESSFHNTSSTSAEAAMIDGFQHQDLDPASLQPAAAVDAVQAIADASWANAAPGK